MTLRLVKPAPKLKLTSKELTVCVQLLGKGRTLADALEAIEVMRAFNAQYRLELTPTR